MQTKLYRSSDVATILGISKALAYRLLSQGAIPSVRFGRTVRCRPEDLDRFILESLTKKEISTSLPIQAVRPEPERLNLQLETRGIS